MADADFSLLSILKSDYPNVPITIVLKVMNKFDNNQEKCREALEIEKAKHPDYEPEPSVTINNTSSNNLASPGEGKSITSRIKELQVSHESSPQPKPVPSGRHVSSIERPVGSPSRYQDPKRPIVNQSLSWTVQTQDRPSTVVSQPQAQWEPGGGMITPQTAPADFTPFIYNRSATDIPNINCNAHGPYGGTQQARRPHQMPLNSTSASSSPGEQRRPVKVINIPAGSLSGGSVSPASNHPDPKRHFRMVRGDSGGVCSVSSQPIQRYASTPNISHFRSELRTETSAPQPVHSSSIVVNTTSHTDHQTPERKLSNNSSNNSPGAGRRTILNLTPSPGDSQPSSVSGNSFTIGRPLSTPVQASSPGIDHSKPVFVEIKRDQPSIHMYNDPSFQSNFYQGSNVRPPPSANFMTTYNPHGGRNYSHQYGTDFSNPSSYSVGQHPHEQYPHHPPQQTHQGFNSPPTNVYQSSANPVFSISSYPQYNPLMFPVISMSGPGTSQTPVSLSHYPRLSPHGHGGHSAVIHNPNKSPGFGVSQPSLGSRSNSQDSEQSTGAEYDPRNHHYSNMGSRVSSHSSLSSDSTSSRVDNRDQSDRPRSGSIQEEADYIQALLQHQKSRMQKLIEDADQHRAILDNLRSEVSEMERGMIETNSHATRSFPSVLDISHLCESNRLLQTDIQVYMNEIEMYKSGQTPFNKINPLDQQNFFENMPTGQQDPIYSRTPDGKARTPSPRPTPPPRPPPPIPVRQRSSDSGQATGGAMSTDIFRVPPVPPAQPSVNSGESEEGESWSCSACTFSNHPALKKCEMCEMPRVMPPHPASTAIPPNIPPHQPMASFPSRLAPGVGNFRTSSGSPSPLGHQHHHAGT